LFFTVDGDDRSPDPSHGPDRVYLVIAVEKAAQRTMGFVHNPT
jgi:hypothetical protein